MKLLGFELEDYASFRSRFIDLSQDINVIVGRNNAGKTPYSGESLLSIFLQKTRSRSKAPTFATRVAVGEPQQYAKGHQGDQQSVAMRLFFTYRRGVGRRLQCVRT